MTNRTVILRRFSDGYALLLLAAVAILSHWVWFDPESVLTFGDWFYWPDLAVAELASQWGPWLPFWGMGSTNAQIPFYPFKLTWSLIVMVGGSYDLAVKITFLWPIAILGFWSPYFFSRQTGNQIPHSIALAMLFGATSYFLIKQTGHLPIALHYALSPLFLIVYVKYLEEFRISRLFILAILISYLICVEIRITLVLLAVAFGLLPLYVTCIRRGLLNIVLLGVVCVPFNTYWIFPVLFGGSADTISKIVNRPLFGNHLFSLVHALPLHESSWTGGYPNIDFIPQIPRFIDFVPVMVVVFTMIFKSTLIFNQKSVNRKGIYFSIVYLVGVFLTKQSSPPLQEFYVWAYGNIPFFSFFREAGKFYIITSLGMLGILAYTLPAIPKRLAGWACLILVVYALHNLWPAATGQFGTMFERRTRPAAHVVIEEFLQNDKDSFRVLWLPTRSRWSYFDKQRGSMSYIDEIQSNWNHLIEGLGVSDYLSQLYELDDDALHGLLMRSSIKYIIIPPRDFENDDDFYRYYGNYHPEAWKKALENRHYLKLIAVDAIGSYVFEFIDYIPRFQLIDSKNKIYPLSGENLFSGVFSLFYTQHEFHQKYIRLSEANDGRWQLCHMHSLIEVLFFPCRVTEGVSHTYNHSQEILFDVTNLIPPSNRIWLRHSSVPFFWNGLLVTVIFIIFMSGVTLLSIARR